jgi:GT2 family glycosyltransferase
VVTQREKGPAAGRNLGVINSRGVIIAFTDPDCIVSETWLGNHARHYVSSDVGGVEGNIETDWNQILEPMRISPAGYRFVTANMSYRRDVLERVGAFDEDFKWKEDDDLAYRVMKAGWRILSDKQASVYHPVRVLSFRDLITRALKRRYDVLFYKKHRDVAKRHFRMKELGPVALTKEFLHACELVTLVVIAALAISLWSTFALLAVGLAGLFAFVHHASIRRRGLRGSVIWAVFILLIVVGRMWGCVKFRTFFL